MNYLDKHPRIAIAGAAVLGLLLGALIITWAVVSTLREHNLTFEQLFELKDRP